MTQTLITGGNRGLGFETAKQLVQLGHTVFIGARDEALGEAAAKKLGAQFVQLDVTNDASVEAAAKKLGSLDVLINNAGIAQPMLPWEQVTVESMRTIYETNVFGVLRVTLAMLPLLQKSACPVIVNVGSGLGSVATVLDPKRIEADIRALAYTSSKSALTMLTVQYAKALPGMRVNVVDPGYTATDLNQHRGHQTVEEGAEIIVKMARLDQHGPTGTFQNRQGVVPW